MEEPFRNSDLEENINPDNNKKFWSKPRNIWISIACIFFFILLISIIFILVLPSPTKNEEIKKSEILCFYKVNNFSKELLLFSEEYENINNSIVDMEINGTNYKYNKTFNFKENGVFPVKFKLNERIRKICLKI